MNNIFHLIPVKKKIYRTLDHKDIRIQHSYTEAFKKLNLLQPTVVNMELLLQVIEL